MMRLASLLWDIRRLQSLLILATSLDHLLVSLLILFGHPKTIFIFEIVPKELSIGAVHQSDLREVKEGRVRGEVRTQWSWFVLMYLLKITEKCSKASDQEMTPS
jgi:hypothetical protein